MKNINQVDAKEDEDITTVNEKRVDWSFFHQANANKTV